MPQQTPLRQVLAATAALLCLGSAQAEAFPKNVYTGAQGEIKAVYRQQKDECKGQSGNAKDICDVIAKSYERVALAQLDYNYTAKPKDGAKLYEARYEAVYDISKERCDDLAGKEKDVCVQSAKTERDKAKADLNLAKKVSSAADTALGEHMRAEFKLAKERCQTLGGTEKDACLARAKARFADD